MRVGQFVVMTLLFILAACSGVRVTPRADPQHFKVVAWLPKDYRVVSGSPLKNPDDGDELTEILANEFPIGTVRTEVEKYLLASGDIKLQQDVRVDRRINGKKVGEGMYVVYGASRKYRPNAYCDVSITADYNLDHKLSDPLRFQYICKLLTYN